MRGGI
ncbi:hypothetical protein CGLO_03660 [Colletotrichum gloeosporioides Cg-14]